MILGLKTTIYKVNDLENAKSWYAKAFQTSPYFDEPFYVGFNINGFELGLLPEENQILKGEGVLSYWGVENIFETYTHLVNLGAKPHEAPVNVGGEIMVATVYDPWQNVLGIIYNPEFQLKNE